MSNEESRDYIIKIFESYKKRKEDNRLYSKEDFVPQNILKTYYYYVQKPNFSLIMEEYKKKYIYNESRVEGLIPPLERKGIEEIYDYIRDFNDPKKFNIYVISLITHQKLYSHCPGSCYGGKLRETEAQLKGLAVEVPSPKEAAKIFQKYLTESDKIMEEINELDLIEKINKCIKITTDLIKIQPFSDGNKRTFRSVLNLMFKIIGLPPVDINFDERGEYKSALINAMMNNDYSDLNKFYYYKLCDSIYNLDVLPDIKKQKLK